MAKLEGCKDVTFGMHGKMRDIMFRKTKLGIIAAQYNKAAYDKEKANSPVTKMFSAIGRLGLDLKPMVDVGFRKRKKNTFTTISQFIKNNYSHASISGAGVVSVDYQSIVVSVGEGKMFSSPDVSVDANGKVLIEWSTTNIDETDANTVCYFGVLCPTAERNLEAINVFSLGKEKLATGSATVGVSARWSGQKAYVYGFTRNEKGVVSKSQFLGEVTID